MRRRSPPHSKTTWTPPAALAALRALDGDAGVAPGARFETLAHVDQLLGLDLVADVGRAPLPLPDPS